MSKTYRHLSDSIRKPMAKPSRVHTSQRRKLRDEASEADWEAWDCRNRAERDPDFDPYEGDPQNFD